MAAEAEIGAAVSPRKLWFGFAAAGSAWAVLGMVDIVIAWRACNHQESYGIPGPHPYVRLLYGLVAIAFLTFAVWSGVISYRNWQRLSTQRAFLEAQAVERREFMAVLGVIITVTLGMGIVWLGLLPIFLDICWRAR